MTNLDAEKWAEAKEYFQSNMMKEHEDGAYPKLCDIHDSFESNQYDLTRHNCLGCNFADSVWLLSYLFDRLGSYQSNQDIYFEFLVRLYLLVERAEVIFEIIELPNSYKQRNFKTFLQVKRWANFIKHPKAFMFTHHPEYCMKGMCSEGGGLIEIDDDFVNKYYSGRSNNKALLDLLTNASSVIVSFPCPVQLIKSFSDECLLLESVICENKVFKEILEERSTLEEYYESEDNDGGGN